VKYAISIYADLQSAATAIVVTVATKKGLYTITISVMVITLSKVDIFFNLGVLCLFGM